MSPGEPCELLAWDTEFFGCRIGRVNGDQLDEARAAAIERWSQANRVQALYFLARADDPATVQAAENHRFSLVDIRLTFDLSLVEAPVPIPEKNVRPFAPKDLPVLRGLARNGFSDTRFFSDSHFPRQKAEALYETWITLECQGRAQAVLVAIAGSDQPVGYISLHADTSSRCGLVGLVGVSANCRGKGIGGQLVRAAIDWFVAQGLQQATVVTQAKNLAAQRLYQRCGFLTGKVQLWYHKWYTGSGKAAGAQPGAEKSR